MPNFDGMTVEPFPKRLFQSKFRLSRWCLRYRYTLRDGMRVSCRLQNILFNARRNSRCITNNFAILCGSAAYHW